MSRPPRARASCPTTAPRRHRASLAARWLGLGLTLALCRCGPQTATPIPEPPSLNPSAVTLSTSAAPVLGLASPFTLRGEAGSITPGATVFVTNLDGTDLPRATQGDSTGRFELTVDAGQGDELRLQVVTGVGEEGRLLRSAPADFVIVGNPPTALQPVTRLDCLANPPLELDFGVLSRSVALSAPRLSMTFQNHCPGPAAFAASALRVGGPAASFAVTAGDGVTAPTDGSASVGIALVLAQGTKTPAFLENTLFVVVTTSDGKGTRYPVTVRAVVR